MTSTNKPLIFSDPHVQRLAVGDVWNIALDGGTRVRLRFLALSLSTIVVEGSVAYPPASPSKGWARVGKVADKLAGLWCAISLGVGGYVLTGWTFDHLFGAMP